MTAKQVLFGEPAHAFADHAAEPAVVVSASLAERLGGADAAVDRVVNVLGADRRIVGVITATDVLGEKPMTIVAQRGIRRDELLVRDVMTPQERLQALELADVRVARVGHIVATLKSLGRQHALVVQRDAAGRHKLRGLFSSTQIARQLGVIIPTSETASTFAEIEAQLAR